MRSLTLTLALSALLATVPLQAQKMGSINSNAPRVSQTIEYAGGSSIKLSYTAIAVAQGKTLNSMLDKERGARTRQRFNKAADSSPLGSLNTSKPLSLGGRDLPAGKYDLCFKITDDLKWQMLLRPEEGEKLEYELKIDASKANAPRLCIVLLAGENEGEARLDVDFGNMHTSVQASKAEEPKKEGGAEIIRIR